MGGTYDEEFVGQLLVFLGHGVRRRLGEHADGAKDGDADTETNGNAPSNTGIGAGRVDGARPMGTKGNPVRCEVESV